VLSFDLKKKNKMNQFFNQQVVQIEIFYSLLLNYKMIIKYLKKINLNIL